MQIHYEEYTTVQFSSRKTVSNRPTVTSSAVNSQVQVRVLNHRAQVQVQVQKKPDSSASPGLESYNLQLCPIGVRSIAVRMSVCS